MNSLRPSSGSVASGIKFALTALILLGGAFILPRTIQAGADGDSSTLDFQRDVRPILSSHCFKCHGPDEQTRKGKLRLDVRDETLRPAKSGELPIVPGNPKASEIIRRVFSADEDDLMPPPDAKHPLTDAQRKTLERWVAAGAEYTEHWAFQPPRQAAPPAVTRKNWPRNAIDFFVLAKLEAAGLEPSVEADKYALVRRLYQDLVGLPPTPEEADEFVRDNSSGAYERLVDELLSSPHYGERWARRWLDLARYADTNGYEKDRRRSIWPYRDWVIKAINRDLPYDQFTIEQIAGDMLPNATLDQRIATGFHRNTMLNEEGGIDPLEYRFYSMVDRVHTTATTWLGLTLSCAQCHSHKFDPIQQKEYYQFMAFLNNADEPEIEVPAPDLVQSRQALQKEIAQNLAQLRDRFPVEELLWRSPASLSARSAQNANAEPLDDDSFRVNGPRPEQDVYTLEIETDLSDLAAVQLEAITDGSLPKNGPGRGAEGQAVLSEITASVRPKGSSNPSEALALQFLSATSDPVQTEQPIDLAFDGKMDTGWTLKAGRNSRGTFLFKQPPSFPGGARLTLQIHQQAGKGQTLGRFRARVASKIQDDRPLAIRREEQLSKKLDAWIDSEKARSSRWTPLRPAAAASNLPLLTVLEDGSVLASGDQTKSDTYDLTFNGDFRGVTALRIEALPDPSLPRQGPGRVYYEGSSGDFTLCEITARDGETPLPFSAASHSHANGGFTSAAAIDGHPQTGWSIDGGQGRPHNAVFNFASPLGELSRLRIKMLFERHYSAGLGKFRVWATKDPGKPVAQNLPNEIQELLLLPAGQFTRSHRTRLEQHFLGITPELAAERQKIEKPLPSFPTTLVMAERPRENPRPTYIHKRGEFLQPGDAVAPAVPALMPKLPPGEAPNRLSFARLLAHPSNPLVGRVTMNRQWAAFFGTGFVRTAEDFGYQGELPTHPELLDWLAVELVNQKWSMKQMHRLIVTSATYRQSSRVSPDLAERDPQNRLLARGPRHRLEAELVRDAALRASGLLSLKVGGPSVFPPQPPGVSTEGTYGPLEWRVSSGSDRYRRGLYTFSKRTAPYAMFLTFDAPSGEACVARREVSNTPLQSLTLLNDVVFMEAAQALGRTIAAQNASDDARAARLFRHCLTRPPQPAELAKILAFFRAQKQRFQNGELDAAALSGAEPGESNLAERAAWTAVARALLNLDETVTKS